MRDDLMALAVELSERSLEAGGGPFGAVVARDGEVVGEGTNRVTLDNDPTAHAEVLAIREACRRLDTFDLSGCEMYASCEPCPMCFGAICWSRIRWVCFANTRDDAARIDFSDADIHEEIRRPAGERSLLRMIHRPSARALAVFERWRRDNDRIPY